jgi:peptidoglycan/LPS O-acetylase OafA/YrhL
MSVRTVYRPDIDGLRAIAVLSVVIFHAFPNGKLRGGFVGVDVFFVISGFLITTILLKDLNEDDFSISKFYRRRILRIFPALIFVLATCVIFGGIVLFSDEYSQLGKHVAASAAFIVNIILWGEVGYFDVSSELKPLLHLWSLSVEEQFYIVWPILLFILYRFKNQFFSLIALITAASFFLSIYFRYFNQDAGFFNTLSRVWELSSGGILAWTIVNRKSPLTQRQADTMSVVGFACLLAAIFLIRRSPAFPGFEALLPVCGALLLIGAGPEALLNKHLLSARIFVAVGLVSYPLYLWHWPILSFLRIGVSDGSYRDVSAISRFAAVFIAMILAWLTYRFIEKPVRFGRHTSFWIYPLVTSMLTTLVGGILIFSNNGFVSRLKLDPPSAQVLFNDYPHPLENEACRRQYPEMNGSWSCLLSKPRPAEVAIVGDSHAHQYYASLAHQLPEIRLRTH